MSGPPVPLPCTTTVPGGAFCTSATSVLRRCHSATAPTTVGIPVVRAAASHIPWPAAREFTRPYTSAQTSKSEFTPCYRTDPQKRCLVVAVSVAATLRTHSVAVQGPGVVMAGGRQGVRTVWMMVREVQGSMSSLRSIATPIPQQRGLTAANTVKMKGAPTAPAKRTGRSPVRLAQPRASRFSIPAEVEKGSVFVLEHHT